MRRILPSALAAFLLAGTVSAAGTTLYRVKVLRAGSPAQTFMVGNDCGYGWPPAGATVYEPEPDSVYTYLIVPCVAVGATGVQADVKWISIPLSTVATAMQPPAPALNCGTYGQGWTLSPDGKSCLPPGYGR